jgi:hypothetical protein
MSIWLLRNAYDAGTLAATQPGITPIDPFTTTACGPEPVTVGSKHQPWEVTSSNTSAQQKDDKHDDHNDHYRPNTDVHGLVPLSRPRTALADFGA